METHSPLFTWFFTLLLILLAGRAASRLALARRDGDVLAPEERNRELGHAAMGLGMAVLLAPGLPRPPQVISVCFFAALAVLATVDWARRWWFGRRGRAMSACGPTGGGGRMLDPHHAIVGIAMVVMLLRPTGSAARTAPASMPGMAMGSAIGGAPGAAVLLLLGYVWIAALALGYGMTRVLEAAAVATAGRAAAEQAATNRGVFALLASPATVYACELAMTVLTGLMLLD